MPRHAVVHCAWDEETEVWFVRESEIPGLVTEAATLDAWRQNRPGMMQDLLDIEAATDFETELIAHDRIRLEAA